MPAMVAFGFWMILQLWGASLGTGNVGYGAHLGGAVMGFVFWVLYRKS